MLLYACMHLTFRVLTVQRWGKISKAPEAQSCSQADYNLYLGSWADLSLEIKLTVPYPTVLTASVRRPDCPCYHWECGWLGKQAPESEHTDPLAVAMRFPSSVFSPL